MEIKPNYIVDEQNHKIAVQLDIKTFEKIEEIFENYALSHLMQEEDNDDGEILDLEQAKEYYDTLEKQE
ncbi:MAG: hypothetical protein SCARUB_02596 [Candidatus Scalindua rubra]|uniref:Uncharacterized protein n=1 Tax=Candidatus Scalindua rubra TaxID=1872076 RepID=A0A1E3XBG3_9BACT|nr:MAG: hypothetical protein SCARUB_02596 [Candidatus Scalindua rubra]